MLNFFPADHILPYNNQRKAESDSATRRKDPNLGLNVPEKPEDTHQDEKSAFHSRHHGCREENQKIRPGQSLSITKIPSRTEPPNVSPNVQVKRVIGLRDARLKTNQKKDEEAKAKEKKTINGELIREAPQMPSNMFFQHNTALVPPYNVLVDTNFLSHTVQRKLSLLESMMDCLYAKCNPIITSCVMAELEKLGPKYRLALRVARDERWQRLECDHKGTYADDCLVDRVTKDRIYIVGTNDKLLKRRIRRIAGVPLMSVARGKYVIERLPGAPE
ncbi:sarcosine oxidase [Metarhizium brunneum]